MFGNVISPVLVKLVPLAYQFDVSSHGNNWFHGTSLGHVRSLSQKWFGGVVQMTAMLHILATCPPKNSPMLNSSL